MTTDFIFLFFQILFLAGQIGIGVYKKNHYDELSSDQLQFINIAYFFCMAMVFVMMICVFAF